MGMMGGRAGCVGEGYCGFKGLLILSLHIVPPGSSKLRQETRQDYLNKGDLLLGILWWNQLLQLKSYKVKNSVNVHVNWRLQIPTKYYTK